MGMEATSSGADFWLLEDCPFKVSLIAQTVLRRLMPTHSSLSI